jgi:quercetin dioxygenase-like cupin family protein
MQLRKYRWSKHYESAEEELFELLRTKNIKAERWESEAGEELAAQAHEYDKQLWCAEGSMVLRINGKPYSLQPGDTLDLPANTIYEGVVGMTGVVCYEARSS